MHSLVHRIVIALMLICWATVLSVQAADSQTIVLIRLQAEAEGSRLPLYLTWKEPIIRAHGVSSLGRPYIFERGSLSLSDFKSGWAEVFLEPGIYDLTFYTSTNGIPLQTTYPIKIFPYMPPLYLGSALTQCDSLNKKKKSCGNFNFIDESVLASSVLKGAIKTAVLSETDQSSETIFRSAYNLIEENGINIEINSSAIPIVVIGGGERKFSKASLFGMAMVGIALTPILMLAPSIAELPLKKGVDKDKSMQAQSCMDTAYSKAPMNEFFYKEFKLVDSVPSAIPAVLNISPQNFLLRECSDGFLCFETGIKFELLERKYGYNLYNKTLSYSSDPGRWDATKYSDMLGGDGGKITNEELCTEAGAEFLRSEYAKSIAAMAEVVRADLQVIQLAPK